MTIEDLGGRSLPREGDVLPAEQFRALARFRSSVEHELRSPLNSICLNLELLSAEVAELGAGPAGALAETLAGLRQGVARMTGNVETLLRTALPAPAGGTTPVDLAHAVADVGALCRLEARLMRVRCDVAVPGRPVVAELRQDALQQALLMMAAEILERVVPGGSLAVSLAVEGEAATARFAAEPSRPATSAEAGRLAALELAAKGLGGAFASHRDNGSVSIELSLPLAPALEHTGDAS